MTSAFQEKAKKTRTALRRVLLGPQALAFLPAMALGAFWLGGEPLLIVVSLGLPILYLALGGTPDQPNPVATRMQQADVVNKTTAIQMANTALADSRDSNMATGCIYIELQGLEDIKQRTGEEAVETLRDLTLSRLRNMLRRDDRAMRCGDNRFLVLLGPSLRLDLEAMLQMCARLQSGVEEPASIDNAMRYVSACVGFCTSTRLPVGATGTDMVDAANIALAEAKANGPSALRAWSSKMSAAHSAQQSLLKDVEKALMNGQIQPWFQPQLCTSTGAITGAEALARWIHPERGIVAPAQFLRCLEEAGQMNRLCEVIVQHSLTALRSWDKAGIDIPRVSVNFSGIELRDPKLVDRIQWELDRFGLTPARLGIEVLETVIAGAPDGIVARNIQGLSALGCHIDLDDFGTGNASINALRRFQVHRLKIDRSFVTRVDRDEDQRRMLAAVLGMADRLGLETLAEGVESVGEHALLSQLGCDHVQGFGIARPMPSDQIVDWARAQQEKIAEAQRLGRDAG